ncbi:hypothetical protein SPFCAV_04651 [Salmonella enterica subsp. enterica serovar Gallinarum/Pullorum str. FCAV198]|nr:hypothetical protein SPFCAV_04651 [Salmonella enterica subsp. enterica serovar Gallinarum/Pullorum str. FCAV198]
MEFYVKSTNAGTNLNSPETLDFHGDSRKYSIPIVNFAYLRIHS